MGIGIVRRIHDYGDGLGFMDVTALPAGPVMPMLFRGKV